MSVSVNGPKTPVTKGSNGIATATLPNVCKMPGPPAPFVPAPLPNIGKTGDKPKGYSKKVKIEKKTVAIKGASFCSMGDIASKGTGGGMLSSNTHGPCKFISPGSMDVKFEGKNVHLLTDMVTNNGGPSGNPANAATMMGTVQASGLVAYVADDMCPICEEEEHTFEETAGDSGTRGEAQALSNAYSANSMKMCMIAVVHCTRGHKHARKSGANKSTFNARASAYHRSTDSAGQVLAKMQELRGNNNAFNHILAMATHFNEVRGILRGLLRNGEVNMSDLTNTQQGLATLSRNPPGSCAAQGALVLALEHDCTPSAMSEVLHAQSGRSVTVRHRNAAGAITVSDFGPGDSVPPCETCNLLVPFLTCPNEEQPSCENTTADCLGC